VQNKLLKKQKFKARGAKIMKQNKKAKWIVGTVGVAFSAFVLSQFSPTETTSINQTGTQVQDQLQNQGTTSSGQFSSNNNDSSNQNSDSGWSFNDSQSSQSSDNSGFNSNRQSGRS
jgi:hypothetical protein